MEIYDNRQEISREKCFIKLINDKQNKVEKIKGKVTTIAKESEKKMKIIKINFGGWQEKLFNLFIKMWSSLQSTLLDDVAKEKCVLAFSI